MEQVNKISSLLLKRMQRELNADEEATLDDWIAKNSYGTLLSDQLKSEEAITIALQEYAAIDINSAEQKIRARVQLKIADNNKNLFARPVHRIHFLRTAWLRFAAAVIILFGIGAYLWNIQQKKTPASTAEASGRAADIMPGWDRAVLTLSDGKQVELNDSASRIIQDGTLTIENNNGGLSYAAMPSSSDASRLRRDQRSSDEGIAFNTMTTPKGGQYKLTLADGTRVWLNAASSITYPTSFNGNSREVSITGEAYFEVRADKSKPFIVKTEDSRIAVLGTSFNVNAYEDEQSIKVSLAEGSVKIDEQLLQPGQAYQNGTVATTNLQQDLAWKNGYFSFENKSLQQIMKELARWYDIEVIYEGQIPRKEFIGEVGRNLNLSQVLKGLEKLGVKFSLQNNRRVVITR